MKNHLASAATLCLLITCLFAHHTAIAQSYNSDEISSGTLYFDNGNEVAPLFSTDVDIHISGMLSRTTLTQNFENTTTQWQEGIYVFPLPDNASVDELEMKVANRIIKGVIKPREEAARQYQRAKNEGKRASLIEQQRRNLFTTHVANIAPGESVEITIGFQTAVHYDEGIFSTHFPLTMTPRYIPGQQLNTTASSKEPLITTSNGWADAHAITPPMVATAAAARTTLNIVIEAGIPLQSITSETHSIITTQDNNLWRVALADPTIAMDRDFTLSWQPPLGQSPHAAVFGDIQEAEAEAEAEAETDTDTDTDTETETETETETFASIMLLPPQNLFNATRLPREVIFVIDTSGSMQGNSIKQARRALSFGINRLSSDDTFNIIEFDDNAHQLFITAREANVVNQQQAVNWVNNLYADGGTEIATAVELALNGNGHAATQRIRQIVFVTDGSVGNEDEIFRFISKNLGTNRIFTVGIGSAPNTWFMRKAAEIGRGSYTLISNLHDVKDKMLQLFSKLERPVLTDIKITFDGMHEPELFPATIPDLYAGEPVLADARWQGKTGAGTMTISGNYSGQSWSRQLQLDPVSASRKQLAKRFAHRKIESLEDSLLFSNNADSIEQEITNVALRYGLISKYTSLIAVENKISREPSTHKLNTVEIPSAMPAGNTMAFPQGSLGLTWRWLLAVLFTALAVLFGLATLHQVRQHHRLV